MRSKDTGDGRKILAKVEVPLSVEDIATYALRYLDEIDDDNQVICQPIQSPGKVLGRFWCRSR